MPATVTITGDTAAALRLAKYGVDALHLKDPLDAAADYAEGQIKATHRDRTGRLRRSFTGGDQYRDVTDDGFSLGTDVHYARWVFNGTKTADPHPPTVKTTPIGRDAADRINSHLEH